MNTNNNNQTKKINEESSKETNPNSPSLIWIFLLFLVSGIGFYGINKGWWGGKV